MWKVQDLWWLRPSVVCWLEVLRQQDPGSSPNYETHWLTLGHTLAHLLKESKHLRVKEVEGKRRSTKYFTLCALEGRWNINITEIFKTHTLLVSFDVADIKVWSCALEPICFLLFWMVHPLICGGSQNTALIQAFCMCSFYVQRKGAAGSFWC